MQQPINFGIDLGTTYSAIGKYEHGKVILFKNPKGFRELLPSVVGYKSGKILVGEKALDLLVTQPGKVVGSFKRGMGTDSSYRVEGLEQAVSPVELSAEVVKSLLGFVQDETVEACVITIPASFDTIQSNATRKAGELAGLKEVVLLQEPIAACLAYANDNQLNLDTFQRWLVYDFGGGTFDSALVEINHRELKVKNHLGNNFLGGFDIDRAILNQVIVPAIDQELWDALDKDNKEELLNYLLSKAEEAKKDLSLSAETTLELEFEDAGLEMELLIKREAFEALVKPYFEESLQLLNELMRMSGFSYKDVNRIVLVGGTTYIPYIREQLRLQTGLVVDSSIDPTTAVARGAVYYAGTRMREQIAEPVEKFQALKLHVDAETQTRDLEELLSIHVEPPQKGRLKILRSNDKQLVFEEEINGEAEVFVPLLPKELNRFDLQFESTKGKQTAFAACSISHGLYSVSGQPLPADICLELDTEDNSTLLEPVFSRNSLLPLKHTLRKTLSRTIRAGSEDALFINVLEGRRGTLPASNLSIGLIEIKGTQVSYDLVKGTAVELELEMSESRDLSIRVRIPSAELDLGSRFNAQVRVANKEKIEKEIALAQEQVAPAIVKALQDQDFELAARLQKLSHDLEEIKNEQVDLYRIDEQKRSLLRELDQIQGAGRMEMAIQLWEQEKQRWTGLEPNASAIQRTTAERLIQTEKAMLDSGDVFWVNKSCKELSSINSDLFYSKPENYVGIFLSLQFMEKQYFRDERKRAQLIARGESALEVKDYSSLMHVCHYLFGEIKPEFLKDAELKTEQGITGIR
ncbi:MAG: Hsp70 family protein [Bacteroidia bacterium]|nr:Hsp70 family protein [Bacteroidia bacterium]